jgi:hypothetical protein
LITDIVDRHLAGQVLVDAQALGGETTHHPNMVSSIVAKG